MIKAIASAALAALLAAGLTPAAAQLAVEPGLDMPAPDTMFEASLNGQSILLASEPIAVGADILVPLRDTLMALGAQQIQFFPSTNQVAFVHNGRNVILNLTTRQATIDGQMAVIPGPLLVRDGRTYVRSEFLGQLQPGFAVTRVRVAGFRGAPGFPEPAPVRSFTVGGQQFVYSAPTFDMGDVLMVPLAETLSAMGVEPTAYQPGDLQVTFTHAGRNVLLNTMSGYAYVGGQAFALDRPVVAREGVVYVPASFLAMLEPSYTVASP